MYQYQNFQEMLSETRGEGDRACALILAANLDNRLRELLSAFFVAMPSSQQKAVFEGTGPLSAFSSRISIAYACGLLSEDEFHDLNIIRKIRNAFAHEEHGWSFGTDQVRDRCRSLKLVLEMRREHPQLAHHASEPRAAYQIAAASLTLLLMNRAKEATGQKRQPYPATSILSRSG